ncbi:MAG: hypothetical protein C4321_09085, partial [Chloroflexota bacterium]
MMIKHCVLLKFRTDVPPESVTASFEELAALKESIPGLLDFAGGAYSSPEGLNRGYTHGFVMSFESAAHRDVYLSHAGRPATGGQAGRRPRRRSRLRFRSLTPCREIPSHSESPFSIHPLPAAKRRHVGPTSCVPSGEGTRVRKYRRLGTGQRWLLIL